MRNVLAAGLAGILMMSGTGAKQTGKPDVKVTATLDMQAPNSNPSWSSTS